MRRRQFLKNTSVLTASVLLPEKWMKANKDGPDFFTLGVLPDTQYYSREFPHVYTSQTKWLRENAEKYRIPFVCHEGDVVQYNDYIEWERAVESHKQLDGIIPYGLNVGNHDYSWSWIEGKRGKIIRESSRIDQFFPASKFEKNSWWGECMDKSMHNSCQFFKGPGNLKFIVLNIEFFPRKKALEWGNYILDKYPTHRAIVVTHAYMFNDDTRIGPGDSSDYQLNGANGEDIWEKLIRKHRNVFLTLSGHICSGPKGHDPKWTETGLLTSKGDHGNLVHQILADYQARPNGGNGFLRLMRFLPEQDKIEVSTYSPFKNEWLRETHNQFVLNYKMS